MTLALLSGGVVMLLLIIGLTVWFSAQTSEHTKQLELERDVMLSAETVLDVLLNAESGKRGYLLTGDETFLQPYHAANNLLKVEFELLEQAVEKSASLEPDAVSLRELANKKMIELKETVEFALEGNRNRALEIVKSPRGRTIMDNVTATLTSIIENAKANVERLLRTMERDADRLRLITLVGALAVALFASGAFYLLTLNSRQLLAARDEIETLNVGLEERVNERTLELTRANDEIQRFAYIVSHDLRAPLVNIMGFTSEVEASANALKQYFQTEEPTEELASMAQMSAEEELPEALQFIRASTAKMDNLIATILKISREGRRKLTAERIDLEQLIARSSESLQHQIENRDAEVKFSGGLPSLVSDRVALEQIFGNLLDNAVKYLSADRPGLITVEGEQSGGRVKVTITDNGRGIDEKDLERIFELFRRAGKQDTTGEGVGLAYVRALVRRLGGDVTVTSRVGEGSTFVVDLPKKAKFDRESAKS